MRRRKAARQGSPAAVLGTLARVTATLGVRDWSDNWDDFYEGTVYFAVLAE